MKHFLCYLLLLCNVGYAMAQANEHQLLYNPTANAETDIQAAVKKAQTEHKNVLLQIGGNWCKWCVEFNRFCHAE